MVIIKVENLVIERGDNDIEKSNGGIWDKTRSN